MLLADMTKEELEILAREQNADLSILLETKKKALENNSNAFSLCATVF